MTSQPTIISFDKCGCAELKGPLHVILHFWSIQWFGKSETSLCTHTDKQTDCWFWHTGSCDCMGGCIKKTEGHGNEPTRKSDN